MTTRDTPPAVVPLRDGPMADRTEGVAGEDGDHRATPMTARRPDRAPRGPARRRRPSARSAQRGKTGEHAVPADVAIGSPTGRTRAGGGPFPPLIGRDAEVATALRFLRAPATRLLTLTGPGGVGKSRLADELLRLSEGGFADGAAFVPLAAVADPSLVAWEVARTLGVAAAAGRSLLGAIHDALAGQELLLVLDNVEHLTTAAPFVADLLRTNPALTVLATSRVPLHVPGEQELPLAPLSVPAPGEGLAANGDPAGLVRYGAVALFVQRARAANPAFALDGANAAAVAELCRRLDGLPLAVVIAAAQVKAFPPPALLARLRERGPLSWRRPEHGLAERERTMRAAVAWSHELLAPDEAVVFRRLAVFVGGAEPEMIAAVCGADAGGGAARAAVEDALAALVDKSLLSPLPQADGSVRYAMLETVRAYAAERLAASGEEDAVRRRHARQFVAFSETAEDPVRGDDQAAWLERVEAEHGNLRTALQWTIDRGEADLALRLSGLRWFWEVRGYWSEGQVWVHQALAVARAREADPELRAKALVGAATFAREQGDLTGAERHYREALAIFRATGSLLHASQALNSLGLVAIHQGETTRAEVLLREGLAIREALHQSEPAAWLPRRGIAYSRLHLAKAAVRRGDPAAARRELERCLPLFVEVGDARGVGLARLDWATASYLLGDLREATHSYRLALKAFVELRARPGIAACLTGLAAVGTAAGGQPEHAARLLGAADAIDDAVRARLPHVPRALRDTVRIAAEAALGHDAFATARAEGRQMALSEMVATAGAVDLIPEGAGAAVPASATRRGLTPREVEVLRELVKGRTNPQIGKALLIAPHTVASHVKSIREKLGTPTRTAAATVAMRDHLV